MQNLALIAHKVLSYFLIAAYVFLAIRFYIRRRKKFEPMDATLSQTVRISLLLVYLSGLLLSMNYGNYVERLHHYSSLLPVAIMLISQIVFRFIRSEMNSLGYAIMTAIMAIVILYISISGGFLDSSIHINISP